MQRRHILTLSLASLGLCGARATQAQGALGEAINKAGRQRMLSQRIGKAWLALGQQVEPQRAGKVLLDSMSLFEHQLQELKAFAPTPDIRATYSKLDVTWGEFKTLAISRPTQAAAAPLLSLDGQVLALAQQGTQQLEQYAGKPVSQLINVAGRQRMLSQRMAKLHLAATWKALEAQPQLDQAKREFSAALDQLASAPLTSPAIQQQIGLARQQWLLFEASMSQASAASQAKRDAENVFIASENMLQVMDQITTLYVRLGA